MLKKSILEMDRCNNSISSPGRRKPSLGLPAEQSTLHLGAQQVISRAYQLLGSDGKTLRDRSRSEVVCGKCLSRASKYGQNQLSLT
jgi:hypothetical protein